MDNFLKKAFNLLKSKTVWVNFIMAFLVIAPRVVEHPEYTLSPETTSLVIFIANIILRWITKKPLEEK